MPDIPELYFDLASPYAYLAVERADSVLGEAELTPVLLGAIFKRRGWGSWAATGRRAAGIAEIEQRARRYRLPPVVWPGEWPANSLVANRAATWAKQQGAVRAFVQAVYRRQFAHGADITRAEVLAVSAVDAGLEPNELLQAVQRQEVKDALRQATDEGWDRGVRGVPAVRSGRAIFYGDDRLEEAAAHVRSTRAFTRPSGA